MDKWTKGLCYQFSERYLEERPLTDDGSRALMTRTVSVYLYGGTGMRECGE